MSLGKNVRTAFCVTGLLLGLGVNALFAVDIRANVMIRGDVARWEKQKKSGDLESSYLLNNPVNQKDNPGDGLILEVDAGLAGAHLAMWYKTATNNGSDGDEEDDWNAHFRRTYVWFKPIDALKLQIGYVGCDQHFKEKIDEWKVGSPFAVYARNWGAWIKSGDTETGEPDHPGYINCNDVEGWGFGFEFRPIEPLIINAGITPGKKGSVGTLNKDKSSIYTKTGESTLIAPWGIGARYFFNDFEFQASFRDGGMDKSTYDGTWRVARLGVGYKNERTSSFIQPILGFDYNKKKAKWAANGLCLDMYSEVYVDAWTFILHAPVTFRWSDEANDKSYMEGTFKVKYNTGSHGNLDDVSPYFMVGSNRDDAIYAAQYRAWLLDSTFSDSFNLSCVLGVNFKIAIAEIDVGVKYDALSNIAQTKYDRKWVVSVPFLVKIKNF
ncbi:MAG: hypothetical protein IJS09_04250 [Treponema sp.]|nr:hypothetical protein [Treponema sp.]